MVPSASNVPALARAHAPRFLALQQDVNLYGTTRYVALGAAGWNQMGQKDRRVPIFLDWRLPAAGDWWWVRPVEGDCLKVILRNYSWRRQGWIWSEPWSFWWQPLRRYGNDSTAIRVLVGIFCRWVPSCCWDILCQGHASSVWLLLAWCNRYCFWLCLFEYLYL